jgi:hypothetical protein
MTSRRRTEGRNGRRTGLSKATAGALAVGLLVGTIVAVSALQATSSTGDEGCEGSGPPLRIVAVPEVAEVLSRVVQLNSARVRDCPLPISIKAGDAGVTALGIRDDTIDRPDIWIPDSSLWIERAGAGLPASSPSVASSPLTLAVTPKVAQSIRADAKTLTLEELLPVSPNAAGPARWMLPDADSSASTIGAVIGLRASVGKRADANALLSTVIRAADRVPVPIAELGTGHPRIAVPVSEQQLFAHNTGQPSKALVGAYPRAGRFAFDYPFVVLSTDRARGGEADDLLTSLRSDVGQRMLAAAGFRAVSGEAGPALAAMSGIDAGPSSAGEVPGAPSVEAAVDSYRRVIRPSRLLALIDVSGSMGRAVPGTHGATRLDLAVQASLSGLAVYSDDTSVGLWVFSTGLAPKTDYRVMAPLNSLTRGPDGVSGRERMAQGLSKVKVEKGKTGLYDSVLAAVREVRRTWDPERVNSVVVITDGADTDPQSIGKTRLLTTLRKENDPKKPVAVFAIAYGPTGDLSTLTKISEATGGRAYAAPDPRMINEVMADAIGRRACEPDC